MGHVGISVSRVHDYAVCVRVVCCVRDQLAQMASTDTRRRVMEDMDLSAHDAQIPIATPGAT